MRKVVILLLAALGYFVFDLLASSGYFKTITPSFSGEVVKIYTEAYGPEDIDLDVENERLFISSDNRRAVRNGKNEQGGVFLLDLKSNGVPSLLPSDYSGDFHPHGISYLKKDSLSFLLVINHSIDGDFVERFMVNNDSLIHQASFEDRAMCCPNDLVAVDIDKFYITNDHGYKTGVMRKLEDYLRIPMSYVLYYDGMHFSKVVEDVNYANGINVSNNGRKIYLTGTTSGLFYTFERNVISGALNLIYNQDLKSGLDNIHVDENGAIWIGAHPKLLDFVGHSKSEMNKSPSQVLKLVENGEGYDITEIYLDDGHQLSGSSVAVPYGNEVFIGVVFENKVLRGKLY